MRNIMLNLTNVKGNPHENDLIDAIYLKELYPLYEKFTDDPLYKEVHLREIDKRALVSIKTENRIFLNRIDENTTCQKLRDYIRSVTRMKIDRQPINMDRT
jgi:hypothetical protein